MTTITTASSQGSQSPRYIPVADTAKLIRTDLKANFPGIKFSVKSKSYSGGASIHVSWFDGPTEDMVNAIIKQYEGASFDGMIDLKSYHDGELNGEPVHFGADYVNCERKYSRDFLTKACTYICKLYGFAMPTIEVSDYDGSAWVKEDNYLECQQCHLRTFLWREYRNYHGDLLDNLEAIGRLVYWLDTLYHVYEPFYRKEQEAERAAYLATELLPSLNRQRDGFAALGDRHAVELLETSIAQREQELVALHSSSSTRATTNMEDTQPRNEAA